MKAKAEGVVARKLAEAIQGTKGFWLVKTEADVYSIDRLRDEGTCLWEGVRNYQARNFMRDNMRVGDQVLVYHSNSEPTGIVGLCSVTRTGIPDPTAFAKKSPYFDEKSDPKKPTWICAEFKFEKKFMRTVVLDDLRAKKELTSMLVIQKGQRLSVQPVTTAEFKVVVGMAAGK